MLDEEARAREADLARVVVLVGRGRRRRVEVGVVEHDERRLAPELERHRGEVRGGVAVDGVRGRRRARERDPVDISVSGERSAGAGARPVDDVEDPGWEARFVGEVAEERTRERRPLGRLQHDRVPRRERRPDPPGREHERRVPGGRDGGDAGGVIADAVALAAGERASRVFGEAVLREIREEADVVGRAREHAQAHRLVQRSVVGAFDLGQVGDGLVDRVGEASEVGVSFARPEICPRRERLAGGGDGRVDLGMAAVRDLRELPAVPVDRAPHLEGRLAGDPPAVDVVVDRDGYAIDLDLVAHAVAVARSATTVRIARTSSSLVL